MILISGAHGVGKSYFCNIVKERLGIEFYTASALIEERKKEPFPADKLIKDIDKNQLYLLDALKSLKSTGREFILDGHFCLFNTVGEIIRIPKQTYIDLMPDRIILLTEDPEVIAIRLFKRDGIHDEVFRIRDLQNAEIEYAKEISQDLSIPLEISEGSSDLDRIIETLSSKER
jgi:adenylate kinase